MKLWSYPSGVLHLPNFKTDISNFKISEPVQFVERVNVPVFVVDAQSHSTEYTFPNDVKKMTKIK